MVGRRIKVDAKGVGKTFMMAIHEYDDDISRASEYRARNRLDEFSRFNIAGLFQEDASAQQDLRGVQRGEPVRPVWRAYLNVIDYKSAL